MSRRATRNIILSVLIVGALLTAVFVVAVGSRPYDHPIVALEPGGQDASFDGLSGLIAEAHQHGARLHVLWVHGMCTHDMRWAADRANRIATALGGQATQTGSVEEAGGLTRVLYGIQTGGGSFDATFVLWSPMTRAFKRTLGFDAPGADRATGFLYERAALNGALKTNLVNDCLSDAVVYSGQNGDAIRGAMQMAVCHELGGVASAGQPCDLTGSPAPGQLAVVTESLGSKVLFDAARAVYHDVGPKPGAREAMNARFASVRMIFLMANQIPLLDIASPMGEAAQGNSLGDMVEMVHDGQMAMAAEHATPMVPPTVVAFTDPNDLLSYRLLPPVVDLAGARLINVIASNAATWLGFLERPDVAHCGYILNPMVIGLMALGHKAGAALPQVPIVDSSQCL